VPYVQLSTARLFYDAAGHDGSPVLLIMGFGVPGRLWMNQIPTLAEHHRVAWFDNCGAGDSRRTRRLLSTRELGAHAAGVMDALGWSDAHVVGVSMGGMVAQELALGHRERIRSLSLIVTHPGGLRNMFPGARALSLFVTGFLGPRRRRARALERLIYPPDYLATVDRRATRDALRTEVVDAAPLSERLTQLLAIAGHRAGARLAALDGVPTLVVSAGRDLLVRPRECRRLHTLIPGSRLVEFAEAGHAVLHQCSAALNRELLAHFRDADGRTAIRTRSHLTAPSDRRLLVSE
jgi:3-oxoadipate enol-lactonase